ncbi:Armadillo-type fold [Arabidopsis thaliana x Arabidopsis arenosa]|nr:Armadillo-type fold [Arabidopsis thaliana x Arabidopsis arenosa]KAG7612397.1 Armadillo-type fold [Arabidopsis suecica]
MSSDKKLVLMGAKILSVLLAQDSIRLCSYVVRPETYLLGLLVKGMMEDFGDEMESLFVDIIQNVLGCGGAQVSDKKTNMQRIIWDIFCEKHLPELVDFIMASCPERPGDTSEGAFVRVGSHRGTKPGILLRICELLCSCVQLDPSRTNFLHNSVIEKVLLLTRRKEKTLVAAAVRFVRTLLSVHNDNVQSYIVENNTLKPIIEVFVANRHRDNLMTAAVLELLEHIRKEYAVLVKYVGDTFWDQLAPFENLRSIKDLKTKYEKGPKSTTDDESDMRQDGRALDEKKPASASSTQMEEADPHNSNATAASSASSTQMEDAEPYNPDVTAASSTCSTQMEVAEPYNPGVTAASSTSSTQMEEADPYNPDVTAASSTSITPMEVAEPYNPDVTAASSTSITPMEVAEPYNPDVTAASSVSPSKRSGGLVDYEDDEDELEKSKRQKLSSTSEGNKNTPEQGGEAKEPGEL